MIWQHERRVLRFGFNVEQVEAGRCPGAGDAALSAANRCLRRRRHRDVWRRPTQSHAKGHSPDITPDIRRGAFNKIQNFISKTIQISNIYYVLLRRLWHFHHLRRDIVTFFGSELFRVCTSLYSLVSSVVTKLAGKLNKRIPLVHPHFFLFAEKCTARSKARLLF